MNKIVPGCKKTYDGLYDNDNVYYYANTIVLTFIDDRQTQYRKHTKGKQLIAALRINFQRP